MQAWRERFEIFARERTRRATSARLPPYRTEFQHPDEHAIRIGNAWTERLFDGPFYLSPASDDRRPACSLVFVQSADGNTGAEDPSTLGGGITDTHLIYEGLSRLAVDAVLAGADTVRGHDLVFSVWHPELVSLRESLGLPRHPTQIVATARGLDLDATLLYQVPDIPAILITVAEAADRMAPALRTLPWVTPVVMRHADDLPWAFEQLRALGVRRLSCVGGRQLAGQLSINRLVDDVYLTTSPRPGGQPGTPIDPNLRGGRVIVRKLGSGPETGVVFEHLRPAREQNQGRPPRTRGPARRDRE